MEDKPLKLSQLHCVSENWLSDGNDWGQIFSQLVSPEISERFEKMIMTTFKDNKDWMVKAGPPKTLARCLAKSREYMSEFKEDPNLPRWAKFTEKFKSVYKRLPSNPGDFIWNVVDFARCSITVPDANNVIKVKRVIEQHFPVVCIKNSYNSKVHVKGSGYRDLKLLIEVEFDDLKIGGVPQMESKTKFICELQIVCLAWLNNKKSTSMSYKILRAQTLLDLFNDASKYVNRDNTHTRVRHNDITEIIKNGWLNLAKVADFSKINADSLLLNAAEEGWSISGVEMLIKDLMASKDCKDSYNQTPLILACKYGRDDIAKFLIKAGSSINSAEKTGYTALIWAAVNGNESCVRALLSAGACRWARDKRDNKTALDHALGRLQSEATEKFKRIVNLLKRENMSTSWEIDNKETKF